MKVSVVVITFNHEPFIARALDSILSQRMDGEFEVVVSEDCSTDCTRAVLREYESRYPGRVRLILSPRNQNTNEVLTRAIDAARGSYVALLEGDDYWTAPHKLQSQIEFMEAHPGYSACFHNARIVYDDGRARALRNTPGQKALLTIDDLWESNPIATCSVMFRNGLIRNWPAWYRDLRYGDWPLHILHAEHGSIGYLDEVMATYRVHRDGIFGGLTDAEQLREVLRFYDEIDGCFDYAYHSRIERAKVRYETLLAQLTAEVGAPAIPGKRGS